MTQACLLGTGPLRAAGPRAFGESLSVAEISCMPLKIGDL
jgi:hypothetical protein